MSSAASTVFWCVSGTLRIQPSGSRVLRPRASRKVSLSVSMISGAGIDSGIAASREKIDLSYANRREERTPDAANSSPVSVALVLAAAAVAGAAGPELKSDDDKTLYALGLVISQNLASFNLSAAELDAVQAGISDGVLKKEHRVDVTDVRSRRSRRSRRRAPARWRRLRRRPGQVVPRQGGRREGRDADRLGADHHDAQAGHGPLAEGRRQGESPLPRHARRRHGLRQLRPARTNPSSCR